MIFVEKEATINSDIYLDDNSRKELLPWAQERIENSAWIFEQNSERAQKFKMTQEWCTSNLPSPASEWPANSPVVDYCIRSILGKNVCAKMHGSRSEILPGKSRKEMLHAVLCADIESDPKRLKVVILEIGLMLLCHTGLL